MAKKKAKKKRAKKKPNHNNNGWKDRIVRMDRVAPESLTPNPRNWRKHPDAQGDALKDVLRDVGWVSQVIVNERTGFLVDGHERVELAVKEGEESVPVIYVDLSEVEEATIMATLDPIGAMARTDADALSILLAEITSDDDTKKMIKKLISAERYRDRDKPPPPAPAEDEAQTKLGDVWTLGRHRMMCGDSANDDHIKELMDGAAVDCLFTSPPYNVDVKYTEHDDTHRTAEEYLGWLSKVCELWIERLSNARAFIWNIGVSRRTFPHRQVCMLEDLGLELHRQYVWNKVGVPVPAWHLTQKNQSARYVKSNFTHEMVYVMMKGQLEAGDPTEFDSTLENDVFKVNQTLSTEGVPDGHSSAGSTTPSLGRAYKAHPAVFPIKLPTAFIQLYTAPGETIADPFGGTGTTMLAAEELNRTALLMEIDPTYCDVILKRWADLTGGTPIRNGDGQLFEQAEELEGAK
jgi:DNA modification methylase